MAKAQRPTRTPVSGPRDILTVTNQDPNYVYRWVNDETNRIQRFLDGGYEIVQAEEGQEIGQKTVDRGSVVGSAITKNVGGTLKAVLMRIPREWYTEDQEAKQEDLDALEATMRESATQDRYGSLTISRK